MKHNVHGTPRRGWIVLVLALVMLSLAITPTFAQSSAGDNVRSAANAAPASCVQHSTSTALGRDGGLMALRGPAEHAASVARIVQGDPYTLQPVRTPSGGVNVVYTRTDCLGREGGLLSPGNQ
jgi:hypothetical protein